MLETICDDDESINGYGSVAAVTKEMEVPNGTSNRRNSNIRRNDNYFMSTNTYGTDVPGSYRLDNLRPKNVSPKQRKKKSKRRYSVSVLGGFGVA